MRHEHISNITEQQQQQNNYIPLSNNKDFEFQFGFCVMTFFLMYIYETLTSAIPSKRIAHDAV